MRGRLATGIGLVLLCAGLLVGGFVAFQLFGTAIYEHHQQAALAARLPAAEGAHARALVQPTAPAHALPPVARSPAPTTVPPAAGAPIGYLVIPRIALDAVMVEGVTAAQLRGGPGHYPGTAVPGQAGNAAVAGHRTTYAAPFGQLNQLQVGDPIYVLTAQGLFRYDVVSSQAVAPTDVSVLDPSARSELTLTTCNPRYSAAQRLVVVATFHAGTAPPAPTPPAPRRTRRSVPLVSDGASPWWWAVAAGAGLACLAGLLWLVGRRVRQGRRWVVIVIGLPVLLVAVVVFYATLSLALPPTY